MLPSYSHFRRNLSSLAFSSSPFVLWGGFASGNIAVPLHHLVEVKNCFLACVIAAQYFWDLRVDTARSPVHNLEFTGDTYRSTNTQHAFDALHHPLMYLVDMGLLFLVGKVKLGELGCRFKCCQIYKALQIS